MKAIQDNMENNLKNNNSLTVLLSVLLLISCLIAGFFAYQVQNLTKEIKKLKIEQLSTQTPVPTLDPTANWNTYTNKKYGFSFKYPSEYLIFDEQTAKDNSLIVTFRHINFGKPLSNSSDGFNEDRMIQISLEKSPLTLEEFFLNKLGLNKIVYGKQEVGTFSKDPNNRLYYLVEVGKKNINNIAYIYFNYAGAGAGDWTYTTKGINSQTFATLHRGYTSHFDSNVDQVLSTFTFIN